MFVSLLLCYAVAKTWVLAQRSDSESQSSNNIPPPKLTQTNCPRSDMPREEQGNERLQSGYLASFSTEGTGLHGNERGRVDAGSQAGETHILVAEAVRLG